jgi:flagellar hook-associated protein 2
MTIGLGSWNSDQSQFTGKSGASPVSIDVSSTDTLSSLRDKINSSSSGVSAALVTDASGVRLSLRSTATGAENGFRITTTSGAGSGNGTDGLSRFGFDPPGGTTTLGLKHPATNALATVNGIGVESASNDLTGVVDGLTLRLQKQGDTAVNVDVTRNSDAVVTAVKTFADAYNQLAQYIASQTKYDPSTKTAGTLQGDGSLTNLQARLRSSTTGNSGASSAFPRLSDIGLQMQRDGTLKVDSTKLQAAVGNPTELKKVLAAADTSNAGNAGFARRISSFSEDVLSTGGALTARTDGLQKLISKNSDDQTRLTDRVDSFRNRLVAQYTALDAQVAKLNSLSSYVTQQIAQYNKTTA